MQEALLYPFLVQAMFVLALVTFLALQFVTAPYGRHTRPGWGPTVRSRTGWFLMEYPAALGFLAVFLVGRHRGDPAAQALLALWLLHYGYRGVVYPFRRRGADRPMPLVIALMGASFNLFNGYLNARWVSGMHDYRDWLGDPRFLVGAALFLTGWAINLHADEVLRALRKPGEEGYAIPRGGLYRWVSCPNYLGEILEWTGWAIATWSLPGLAFAMFTFANLVPRAWAHHAWYRRTFPDYPPERRAVFPYVL